MDPAAAIPNLRNRMYFLTAFMGSIFGQQLIFILQVEGFGRPRRIQCCQFEEATLPPIVERSGFDGAIRRRKALIAAAE